MTCRRVLVLITALSVGAVGCGSDPDDAATSTTTVTAPGSSTSTSASSISTTTTTTVEKTTVAVYLVRGEHVGPVRRDAVAASPARSAMEELLRGPSAADAAAGLTSAIPAGTTLLGLTIADGTATVDLTSTFGSGGGSLSMQERVAQVVYTLTGFPSVQRVVFHLDGEPATSLGGEGLIIDQPQTRGDWEEMTPAILVESPLPGDAVASPFHVTGTGNTFEATYLISLTDSAGVKVYDGFGMATSGTGTRGTFDHTITFTGAVSGPAVLKLWEASAKDGSEVNVVTIPVTL